MHFQDMRADAPEIEVAVAPALDVEKHRDEQPDEDQRQRGSRLAAEGQRQRKPSGDHRPVGRRIETGAPDRAAIELAPVEMRYGADRRAVEPGGFAVGHRYLPARGMRPQPCRYLDCEQLATRPGKMPAPARVKVSLRLTQG